MKHQAKNTWFEMIPFNLHTLKLGWCVVYTKKEPNWNRSNTVKWIWLQYKLIKQKKMQNLILESSNFYFYIYLTLSLSLSIFFAHFILLLYRRTESQKTRGDIAMHNAKELWHRTKLFFVCFSKPQQTQGERVGRKDKSEKVCEVINFLSFIKANYGGRNIAL